jgi:hypothetical protein
LFSFINRWCVPNFFCLHLNRDVLKPQNVFRDPPVTFFPGVISFSSIRYWVCKQENFFLRVVIHLANWESNSFFFQFSVHLCM